MGWETFDIDRAEPLLVVGTRIVGSMVKRRRERLGLSQRRLALVIGCDQSVISRLENGKITSMRYRRFAVIVGVLGGLEETAPLPRWRMPFIPPKLVLAVNLDAARLASMPFPPPTVPSTPRGRLEPADALEPHHVVELESAPWAARVTRRSRSSVR